MFPIDVCLSSGHIWLEIFFTLPGYGFILFLRNKLLRRIVCVEGAEMLLPYSFLLQLIYTMHFEPFMQVCNGSFLLKTLPGINVKLL